MRDLSRSPHAVLTASKHAQTVAIDTASVTRWELSEGDPLAEGLEAVKLLGGGTSFEAYLAWETHRHALVVVKVVRPHLVEDEAIRAALRREADALATLAHPVLPRIFGEHLDGSRPLIVLELLDGPRLSTVIRRFGLALEQVLPLALELCSALHYLAAEGWVHRDVKPSNVILASPPRLRSLGRRADREPATWRSPDRHRRVHGAGAVRPHAGSPDRAGNRRLGSGRDALRGGRAKATVPRRRAGRQRRWSASAARDTRGASAARVRTAGNDGTRGGNNTGDGDRTAGNDGTRGGNNTGDGDRTAGNDGTRGGDNTGAAVGGGDTGGGASGGGSTG